MWYCQGASSVLHLGTNSLHHIVEVSSGLNGGLVCLSALLLKVGIAVRVFPSLREVLVDHISPSPPRVFDVRAYDLLDALSPSALETQLNELLRTKCITDSYGLAWADIHPCALPQSQYFCSPCCEKRSMLYQTEIEGVNLR